MNSQPTTIPAEAPFRPPHPVGRIGRLCVWLRRWRHCRGFGVQSPSAYHFIRYVVSEHYPYYAYTSLRRQFAQVKGSDRRLMEFYLRLSNHLQASTAVDLSPLHTDAFRAYVRAGCRRTEVLVSAEEAGKAALLRIGHPMVEAALQALLGNIDSQSVIVVEHIGRLQTMHQLWQRIVGDPRTGVTFDLHYCGVAFFDTDRYKTNYTVNF